MSLFKKKINKFKKRDYESCLLDAIRSNNYDEVESVIIDATNNKYILNINKSKEEWTPLLSATFKENFENVKLLIEYAIKNGIILKINEKGYRGYNPFLMACKRPDIAKLYIDYANEQDITLKINEKNNNGDYPLLNASECKDPQMIELIINYANSKNIILNLKEKNKYGEYPLLEAIKKRNVAGVQALLNYADKNHIILNINEKSEDGNYPLLDALSSNSYEIVKSLLEYSKNNKIVLEFNERDLKNNINNKKEKRNDSLNTLFKKHDRFIDNISELDHRIFELLNFYCDEETLKVNFINEENEEKNNEKDEKKRIKENGNGELVTEFHYKMILSSYSSTLTTNSISSSEDLSSEKNNQNVNKKSNLKENEKSYENNNEIENEKGDLVVVLYDFNATKSDELSFHKDEYLIVTNWNVENGWAIGYKRNNSQEKGKFPYPLVRKCSENEGNEKMILIIVNIFLPMKKVLILHH